MGEKDGIVAVTSRRMAFDLCVVSFRRRQKRLWPFLEPWDLSMGRKAFDVCVVLLRRRQKQQAVFGTADRSVGHNAMATCHPEHARIVSPVATYCSHLRARRSFAEKARCIQRHKRSLLFDLHRPRCTVRSKTAAGGIS